MASAYSYPSDAPTLLRYFWAYRKKLSLGLLFAFLRCLSVAPIPFLFQMIIDRHVADSNVVGIYSTAAIFIGLLFLHFGFAILGMRALAITTTAMAMELRGRIFERLQFLSFGYLDEQKTGRLISKYAFDTQKIEGIMMQCMNGIVPSALYGIMMLTLLIIVNWQLTFILVIILPFFAFVRYYFYKKFIYHNNQTRLAQERLTGTASELISALRLVRSLGEEKQATDQLHESSAHAARTRYGLIQSSAIFSTFVYVVCESISLLVLGSGALFVIGGTLSVGTLFAFMVALPIILNPIHAFTQFSEQYFTGREAFGSIRELLDAPYVEEWRGNIQLTSFKGDIEFQNVRFSYSRQTTPAITDFNLHISPGEHVAFVGPSGSGKSTIANLVLGLYKAQGTILIDGIPQESLHMRSLRRQSAVVMQENLLLSGSILDNIRFANPKASDDEIYEAARFANAEEFIENLPQGYMTMVGERGVSLSGGQRQRISIARAILRNPKLLILDEATSALDYQSEHLIQEALNRLAAGRTVITIAHRLSTIINSDRIVVLDKGRIVEIGTFEELRARNGYFSRLLESQAFSDLSTPAAQGKPTSI
jgi:ABC-type multidrug transport system fused ATPase/permease subunit